MLVYRIEGENGMGPYWDSPIREMGAKHSKGNSHPNPTEEDLDISSSFFCGFPTLDPMKVWFKGWRSKMNKMGFRLKVYEIPHIHVQIGDKQLVFEKEFVREVKSLPIP